MSPIAASEDDVRRDCSWCDRVGDDAQQELVGEAQYTCAGGLHNGTVGIELMMTLVAVLLSSGGETRSLHQGLVTSQNV